MLLHERTYLTTGTELRKLLATATARGHLHRLYWFVEVKLPGHRTRSGRPVLQAASWPGDWIPVIPVGSDPEVSRRWAEMLKALFEEGNRGTGCEHALALTDAERMAGLEWYEWGQAWDCVCGECGAVFASSAPQEAWCGCA